MLGIRGPVCDLLVFGGDRRTTNLALRYSAGSGAASRELLLDGAPLVTNQAFPATANWSTWTTVAANPTLAVGTHTLEVLWSTANGSHRYINLDNLTVTPGVTVPVPTNTSLPTVTGVAQQGQTLTVSNGIWTNSPTSYAYQWNRCTSTCTSISGANSSSYVATASDVGDTLDATVIAANAGGPGPAATSAATATVTAASGPTTQVYRGGNLGHQSAHREHLARRPERPVHLLLGIRGPVCDLLVFGGDRRNHQSRVLRYSAGSGAASRELLLDGAPLVTNQAFPATANWSTWTTVAANPTLAVGTHTLEVLWSTANGSHRYINLDNLTVTPGVTVPVPTNTSLPTVTGVAQQGRR